MTAEKKIPLFHRQENQVWMITSFVTLMLCALIALPAAYAYAGARIVLRTDPLPTPSVEPVMPTVPAPQPEPDGFPVALTTAGE
jgi:hypothetical protein